jgi:predicted metal-binding protein
LIVGDLHREHAGSVVALAQRYACSDHGWVAPADRPDGLRRQVLLRLPPV